MTMRRWKVKGNMICKNYKDVEPIKVGRGIMVRWLTHKDLGGDEYLHNHALRMFTIAPKSKVEIHDHKFTQIVYILSGKLLFSVLSQDGTREEREVGPGDYVYTHSYEPHGIINLSDNEPVNLLCCIDCVDDKENCVPTV
jgi:quercetin dioxygenase-like cupin family protein